MKYKVYRDGREIFATNDLLAAKFYREIFGGSITGYSGSAEIPFVIEGNKPSPYSIHLASTNKEYCHI